MEVEIKGLTAMRGWAMDTRSKRGLLHSTGMDNTWNSSIEVADEIPTLVNSNGIYAYPFNLFKKIPGDVLGVVELRGTIIEHTDGIYRAEWCKILRLLSPKSLFFKDLLNSLYMNYRVPITVTDDLTKTLRKYLQEEGRESVRWNKKILASLSKTPEELYGEPDITYEIWNKPFKPEPEKVPPATDTTQGPPTQTPDLKALINSLSPSLPPLPLGYNKDLYDYLRKAWDQASELREKYLKGDIEGPKRRPWGIYCPSCYQKIKPLKFPHYSDIGSPHKYHFWPIYNLYICNCGYKYSIQGETL